MLQQGQLTPAVVAAVETGKKAVQTTLAVLADLAL
jgi:hypothetical protein